MATATKKVEESSAKEKKKGSKKKLILIILLVVLAAGGGGFGALTFLGSSKPHKAAFVPPKVGPIYGFGTITTNLSDGHLIQLGMSLQLGVKDLTTAITPLNKDMTDVVITDLSGWTYAQLLSPIAKLTLKKQLILDLNKIVKVATGKNEITDIYFTSFIMQ